MENPIEDKESTTALPTADVSSFELEPHVPSLLREDYSIKVGDPPEEVDKAKKEHESQAGAFGMKKSMSETFWLPEPFNQCI